MLTGGSQSSTTLAKTNAQYTFIPGHGDVANARDVVAFRDYLGAVRTLVGDVQRQGKSGAALVEAVLPTLKKNYGRSHKGDTDCYRPVTRASRITGGAAAPPASSGVYRYVSVRLTSSIASAKKQQVTLCSKLM